MRQVNIPRLFWVKKSWTLKEVHIQLFSFMKKLFTNWYELNENPETLQKNRDFLRPPFKKHSIDEKDDREMTYQEF